MNDKNNPTKPKTRKPRQGIQPDEAQLRRLSAAGAFAERGSITAYAAQWGVSKQALSQRLRRLGLGPAAGAPAPAVPTPTATHTPAVAASGPAPAYTEKGFRRLANENPDELARVIREEPLRPSDLTLAAECLGPVADQAGLELLLGLLDHESALVREGVLLGLNYRDAVEPVVVRKLAAVAVNDPSPYLREMAHTVTVDLPVNTPEELLAVDADATRFVVE